jgi:fructose-1,6-bisphosphatase
MSGQSLLAFLRSGSFTQKPHSEAVSATIGALAKAALEVRKLTTQGALNVGFAASRGSANTDGDIQKDLDVVADGIFLQAIREVPVALYGSEENTGAILIDPAKPLALAIDPLDGSSNIETNVSIGTIFSILPVTGDPKSNSEQSFLQPGTAQLAAGFFIYGPQLALVLTVGTGTRIFIHSSKYGDFIEAYDCVSVPNNASEFAINISNYRHWEETDPALHRRLFRRNGGSAREGLQHAVDRVAGGRHLPHPHPRRRVSLSGRQAQGLCARPDCAWSTRPTRSRCWSSRPAARRPTAINAHSRSPCPAQPAPAHVRWSSARRKGRADRALSRRPVEHDRRALTRYSAIAVFRAFRRPETTHVA